MEEKLLIAVVATISALIGSAIPTLFNYWNNNKQRDFEIKKALLDKQKDAYLELLLTLQNLINHQDDQNHFFRLQTAGLQVAIYGNKEASKAFLDYYYDLVHQSQGGREPLTTEEHQCYQAQILNLSLIHI